MSTKKVTDHRDGGHHIRRIETTRNDGSKRIVVQEVKDTFFGERSSENLSVTKVDKHGNSTTTRPRK